MLYGLANNHAMQHGKEAYQQTFDAICGYGSKCFGANKTEVCCNEPSRKNGVIYRYVSSY